MPAAKALNQTKNEHQTVNDTLIRVDKYVRREYLSVLDYATPLAPDVETNVGSNLRLFRLDSFSFDRIENLERKIRSVYGALEHSDISAVLLLDGRKDCVHLYLGVFSKRPEECASHYQAFQNSFRGVFPGCQRSNLKRGESEKLLKDLLWPDMEISIAAVSAFSSDGERNEPSEIGLEALIDGMRGRPFSMILLASFLDRATLVQMRQGYESLYTQISPLQKQDVSFSSSNTDTIGINYSTSLSESLSVTTGVNQSHTDTRGHSHSEQSGPSPDVQNSKAMSHIAGAGLTLLAAVGTGGAAGTAEAASNILKNLFYASSVANLFDSASTLIDGPTKEFSNTDGEHEDQSDTEGSHRDVAESQTSSSSEGGSLSQGLTHGQTVSYSMDNKSVSGLMERLDEQIREISTLEKEGAFSVAAYFIAGDTATAVSAASLYRSLVASNGSAGRCSQVYRWERTEQTKPIAASLIRGIHPIFLSDASDSPMISAAQPVGLSDLSRYFRLPGQSVPGFRVTRHAAFARDVHLRDRMSDSPRVPLSIGSIYHMGSIDSETSVTLDPGTLVSHLFVGGATGLGKSNFCYQITNQLTKMGVNALVIEPTKGEYAKVFGGRKDLDFHIYGTNIRYAPPLRLNPFAFPKGVSSAEHIERLISIFCAAWPMYSAMPAILKEALEEAYRKHGFDDIWGDLPEEGHFPCFQDVLDTLPEIIRRSEYSQEVQGNYIGALVTRVKSLTNGIYGVLFSEDELTDEELFDRNVIIDLSRIGSDETKALIMGFLITRLSERRLCSGCMNSPLKHITILEEAHHLLGRRTQSPTLDGGDMRGASVEMISNAIREMRTYGEGFLIADQSPSFMEPSVISNTQTKVFFMMPKREDLNVASDAASLSEEQGKELAKLPRGVAMVWQNRWTDAVLCKIDRFPVEDQPQCSYHLNDTPTTVQELLRAAVRVLIRNKTRENGQYAPFPESVPDVAFWEENGYALGGKRTVVRDILCAYRTQGDSFTIALPEKGSLLGKLLDFNDLMRRNQKVRNMERWIDSIHEAIRKMTGLRSPEIHLAVSTILFAYAEESKEYRKLYLEYLIYENDETPRK